jgi:hypothetical protein
MMTKKQVWDAKKELEKLLNELPKMSTPELLSYTRMYAETWGVKIEGEDREQMIVQLLKWKLNDLFPDTKLW